MELQLSATRATRKEKRRAIGDLADAAGLPVLGVSLNLAL